MYIVGHLGLAAYHFIETFKCWLLKIVLLLYHAATAVLTCWDKDLRPLWLYPVVSGTVTLATDPLDPEDKEEASVD